ncbi:unnamed protein product [Pleuronectes platessa]|uniref:Uncharacterized protein n=1 Tax=Pleuronectes platessa TaxID=8262 RepID=A0A9N7U5Z7_PLEPL|nr:unnamed protein product [Pleuronectes platessa]
MDNSDEPEDLLDGKIVFQKNKDRTFSKTKSSDPCCGDSDGACTSTIMSPCLRCALVLQSKQSSFQRLNSSYTRSGPQGIQALEPDPCGRPDTSINGAIP